MAGSAGQSKPGDPAVALVQTPIPARQLTSDTLPDPAPTPTAEDVWAFVERRFTNLRAMRPSGFLLRGVSVRAGGKRLSRLRGGKAARALTERLAALSPHERRRFQAMSAVNHEQAVAAVRLSLIANVTVPIGLLIGLAQLTDGQLWQALMREVSSDAALMTTLEVIVPAVVLTMLFVVWYVYAGLQQARDVHHLTMLARAGDPSPDGDAGGTETGDVTAPL